MSGRKISILGAGGWGSALAFLCAKRGHETTLWGHDAHRAAQLHASRENTTYLPGVRLSDGIRVTAQLADCADAEIVFFVLPSIAFRETALRFQGHKPHANVLLSCTKGIEHHSGLRMTEILSEIFPRSRVAVLSGPNLAIEVAREQPTASVIGCRDPAIASELQSQLRTERFRIYTTDETAGVELGGALKNVFALAAGASDGLGLGDNAKAALITRALAELVRLGTAMGGQSETFYGLSGAGDLIATCFSRHSRNRRFGEELGRGKSIEEIRSSTQSIAEGVPTTRSAFECAGRLGVETPIIDQLHAMLYEGKHADEALQQLLRRDPKPERS